MSGGVSDCCGAVTNARLAKHGIANSQVARLDDTRLYFGGRDFLPGQHT